MPEFKLEKLPGEPIVLQTFYPAWTAANDLRATIEDALALLESLDAPAFYIADMTTNPTFSLPELITATNQIARSGNALLHHPNMREHLVVTTSGPIKLAVKGLNSKAFGGVRARSFDTLDEALKYARSQGR